jgi:hypothetical protein
LIWFLREEFILKKKEEFSKNCGLPQALPNKGNMPQPVAVAIRMKSNAARKLRQVPAGCLRVGVDPHKKRHAVVTMTEDLVVQSRFKFDNSKRGLEKALERTKADMVKVGYLSSDI